MLETILMVGTVLGSVGNAPITLTVPSNENLPIVETTSDDNSNAAYKTLFH